MINQYIVFNKKTKQYYHEKEKKWQDYPPEYYSNSINQIYFDYDEKSGRYILPTFKKVDIKDLEIIEKKFQIVNVNEKKFDLNELYKNRMIFKKYQKELGYLLPEIFEKMYNLNQLKKYQYIVKLSDFTHKYVSMINLPNKKNILKKLNDHGINKTNMMFRNPLMFIQNDEHLLTLKLVIGEYICVIEKLEPIINVWMKMNLLD